MKKAIIIAALSAAAVFVIGALFLLQSESYEVTVKKITENRPDAVITVGIWENGKADYKVYGENARPLPFEQHTYAIGSITKTLTGAYIAKLEQDGVISIDDHVDKFLPVASGCYAPTFKSLMTHTSGLSDQWEDELENGRTSGFSQEDMAALLQSQKLEDKSYEPCYSNFGSALAASAAAASQGKSYQNAINDFIRDELELYNTRVGEIGDLDCYWPWQHNDEMAANGAILSNITDMLSYGSKYLTEKPEYLSSCTLPLAKFSDDFDCGYFWIIDKENDIVWHNGEICYEDENGRDAGYQAFIGFSKSKNRVVVVLSNIIAYDNDETAYTDILGYQLMQQGF